MKIQIQPVSWDMTDVDAWCCVSLRAAATGIYDSSADLQVTRGDAEFRGRKIEYCPYCGTKIQIEKVLE